MVTYTNPASKATLETTAKTASPRPESEAGTPGRWRTGDGALLMLAITVTVAASTTQRMEKVSMLKIP